VKTAGRPEKYPRRAIVDAILYVVSTDRSWWQLPTWTSRPGRPCTGTSSAGKTPRSPRGSSPPRASNCGSSRAAAPSQAPAWSTPRRSIGQPGSFGVVEEGNSARAGRASPATHEGQTLRAPGQRIRMLAAEAAELHDEIGRLVAVVALWLLELPGPYRTDQPAQVLVNWPRPAPGD
jgi:hypothetical protein